MALLKNPWIIIFKKQNFKKCKTVITTRGQSWIKSLKNYKQKVYFLKMFKRSEKNNTNIQNYEKPLK